MFLMPKLYGLTVEVGNFFRIEKIRFQKGKLILPLSKKQYADVRILGRETYDFLHTCQGLKSCKQPFQKANIEVENVRPAKTRPDVWIADVSFNNQWQLTFLVVANGEKRIFKAPSQVVFLDKALEQQIRAQVLEKITDL